MLSVVNPAGFLFVWPDGSEFVEVYHKKVVYADEPYEVLYVPDMQRSQSSLNKIANEDPDYARL